MKYKIFSTIKDGKPSNSKLIREAIDSFEGKRVLFTIEKSKKKRSNEQNAWYWGVAIPLIKNALLETGNKLSGEEVHDILKFKFLKEDFPIGDNGEFLTKVKSTTELTTTLFMDFKADVQQWSSEVLGVYIPDPGEIIELDFSS